MYVQKNQASKAWFTECVEFKKKKKKKPIYRLWERRESYIQRGYSL